MSPRLRQWALGVAFAAWTAGTAFLVWVTLVMPRQPMGGPHRDYVLEVPEGASYEQLAALLGKEGVVRHPWAFAVYLRILSDEHELRRRYWVVNRALAPAALVPRIVHGRGTAIVKVLIP